MKTSFASMGGDRRGIVHKGWAHSATSDINNPMLLISCTGQPNVKVLKDVFFKVLKNFNNIYF